MDQGYSLEEEFAVREVNTRTANSFSFSTDGILSLNSGFYYKLHIGKFIQYELQALSQLE